MTMKTTVMAVAMMMVGVTGVAMADDGEFHEGDIPPQPSAIGNSVAEIVNAIKHATVDAAHQEMTDRTQMSKLYKTIDARIKQLEEQRKKVSSLQKAELNASVKASKAGGDDKEQQASELKGASDDLKQADKDLADAIKTARAMNKQIQDVASTVDSGDINKKWMQARANINKLNDRVRTSVEAAANKANHADEVIKKYGGSSTSSGNDVVGAFKVTLKSWSCKKTELYLGDAQYPKASKVGQSIAANTDGTLKMHVMIVGSRREQARKFEREREEDKSSTSTVEITAASNWILNYGMKGGKHTDWRVEKEDYDWKAPEGKTKIDYKVIPSGSNTKSKTDGIEITFPTAAVTNSIHGWVRGEIEWKGAQDEQDSEDCSYELTIEPTH